MENMRKIMVITTSYINYTITSLDFIFCIVMAILGVVYSIYKRKKIIEKEANLVIEFKNSWSGWLVPSYVIFLVMFLAVLVEPWLVNLLSSEDEVNQFYGCWNAFLSGGILIPVSYILFSYLLGVFVDGLYLDHSALYTVKTIKWFFTLITIDVSFIFLLLYWYTWNKDTGSPVQIERIGLWLISIIGIWFPIEKGCIGRIAKEISNTERSNRHLADKKKTKVEEKEITWRVKLKYYCPMLGFFVAIILIGFLVIHFDKECEVFFEFIMPIMISFAVSIFISAIVIILITRRTQKKDNYELSKAVDLYRKDGKEVQGRYGSLLYKLSVGKRSETHVCVTIKERHVKYLFNQKEADEKLKEISKDIRDNAKLLESVEKYLGNENKKRKDYIKSAFEKCKDEYFEREKRKAEKWRLK